MGEVYRARDTRLDGIVAVKISAEQFGERFEREARAVAALNHPNICTLYDVGPNYLVMEYIEGPTLAERIAAGAIALQEALPIARQIAEALEAAHDKGIVHRDLKPANIKLTTDGKAKVLDFGLAKAFDNESTVADPASSPTLTLSGTRAGVILGTAAYMSPEQARGVPANKRADIWSYGVVLFEMLTGRRMFVGETVSDTLAAVLRADFNWPALPAGTPPAIRRLLRRCLERDRKKRLPDIADARLEIDEALAGAPAEQPQRSRALPWAVAAILAAAFVTVSLLHFRESPPEQRLIKLSVSPPQKTVFHRFAVSPDGRRLAFTVDESGRTQLWVRPLDSLTAQHLADAEPLAAPFWSADSRFIAFFSGGKLKKIEASGGPAQVICDAPSGRGGAWNRDGVILLHSSRLPLFRVPAEGGEAKPASQQQAYALWPHFLPDGRHYLFTSAGLKPGSSGIYVGALDSEATTRLLPDQSNAVYSGTPSGAGYLLFWRGGSLMAQPFDSGRLRLSGGPFPVAEHVGYSSNTRHAEFSVSENGVLVYDSAGAAEYDQLVWFDRTGKRLATVGEAGGYNSPVVAPAEKQVAVQRLDTHALTYDLWLIELGRGISTRFTSDPKDEICPVWSPDGGNIVFGSNRENVFNVYRKTLSGSGKDELLLKSDHPKTPTDWSSDGRFLLYYDQDPTTKFDLWVLPLSGDKKPIPFLQTEFNELEGVFSPDGKWIAYQSDESGRYEVYVQPFPAGGKSQISRSGGTRPRWRRDGRELFYLDTDGKMMAVDLRTGASFQAGVPQPLFETHITTMETRYAVTRDGQRFLLPVSLGEAGPATVVINWTAGIKR
jgi:serine/threonine protein kinase/Tol biopolymer transport system component